MIRIEHAREDDGIVIRASGVLDARDYELAVPEIENAMALAAGPLRVLIRLEDFRGWNLGGLWQDLKFLRAHHGDFGRVAVVGDGALEKWGTALSGPFVGAETRFFPADREVDARRWLESKG